MTNQRNRIIKTETKDVFTAGLRAQYIDIPPFYLDGPVVVSTSGPWSPSSNILLTDWYVQAGTVGTSTTTFGLIIGDNTFGSTETVRTISLSGVIAGPATPPPGSIKKSADIVSGYIDNIVVTPSNWIKVSCTAAGGHSDVVVQLYGRAV